MLGKLSLRNAKRQAKDYIIYFITITIAVALIFSFNSLAFSEDISELSQSMKYFKTSIMIMSVIIIIVIAWLVNYTMSFILEKRSKEFATYQILGIEKKDISNIFMLENILIGIVALAFGIVIGTILYQILTIIIMNIFAQPYQITIDFNLKAVGLTAAYFMGIFFIALLNNRRKLKKTKINELLYAEKKNENHLLKKSLGNTIIFLISIVLFITALVIIGDTFKDGNSVKGNSTLIAIFLTIVGIYLFYISISSFITKRYLNNKNRKYKKDNMFLFRNLTSKINTMSVTMGTLAMLFTFIIIGCSIAMLMNAMLNNEIEMGYPFEIMISSADGDFSKYKEYIEKNAKVKGMYEYEILKINETGISNGLKGTPFEENKWYDYDEVMKLSDYNYLRKMLGYEESTLQEDEIIVQCLRTIEKDFEKYVKENNTIVIDQQEYKIKEVNGENFAQTISFNGYIYLIIVPDEVANTLTEIDLEGESYNFRYKFVVQTEEKTDERFYDELCQFILKEEIPQTEIIDGEEIEYNLEISLGNVTTKGERLTQVKSFYTIISFLAFYVSLVFAIASATILAIQQLSDSEKYKYRYQLLRKLGVDETRLNKMIFKQLFIYFILPVFIPVLISIPAVFLVGRIFLVAVTLGDIALNIGIILGLLFLVYGVYFIATYVQFERNIKEGTR